VTEPVLMPDVLQIFDTGNFNILVGPKGLKPGDELTVRSRCRRALLRIRAHP